MGIIAIFHFALQIGSTGSARQTLSSIPASQPQTLGQLSGMPQRDLTSMLSGAGSIMPPSQSQPSVQQQAQQRRVQRSKLPPPSKVSYKITLFLSIRLEKCNKN